MAESAKRHDSEVVGRYTLYGEIASGGMATVHFGRLIGPVGFSRPVAIKRLHPQFAKEPEVRAMFIDEARLVSRIRHPNVVPTLDVVATDGQLLLVMEYVHGESLARLARALRARREHMPLGIIISVMSNVLHGLHAAHEARSETGQPLEIVHRDVSPQNVLVGTDGCARVLDFGIARAAVRLESTREGVIKGKLAYMAPEQLGGADITRQADIYAASVILWELLAGRRLFLKSDEGQTILLEKLMRGAIEPPSTHRAGLSPLLDAITLKGIALDPSQRFSSTREMALALESAWELAPASSVGSWVELVASEALTRRSLELGEFERTSAKVRAHSLADVEIDALLEDGADAGELPAADPPASAPSPKSSTFHAMLRGPETLSPSQASIPAAAPTPRRRRLGARASAALGLALAFVGVVAGARYLTLVATRARAALATEAESLAGGGVEVTGTAVAPPPPAPMCPEKMAEVPGGKFFMGSDEGLPMERPAHNVTLGAYCIDIYEVTTGAFKACSDRGECKRAALSNDWEGLTDPERKVLDPLCNAREPSLRASHPINCVDFEMAEIYCRAQGKRLPTEAEWEFAARGPDGRKYPWGDEEPGPAFLNACGKECVDWGKKNHLEQKAMYGADDGWPTTAPVGSFPKGASRYGVQDVVGNVWEWVSDYYAEYAKDEQVSPRGPESGEAHVIRGGAWNGGYATWVRPTFRYKDVAGKRSYGIGFRCATDAATR